MSGAGYVHVIMPVGSDPFVAEKKLAIAKAVKQAGGKISRLLAPQACIPAP
jgi:hypothetical protein